MDINLNLFVIICNKSYTEFEYKYTIYIKLYVVDGVKEYIIKYLNIKRLYKGIHKMHVWNIIHERST